MECIVECIDGRSSKLEVFLGGVRGWHPNGIEMQENLPILPKKLSRKTDQKGGRGNHALQDGAQVELEAGQVHQVGAQGSISGRTGLSIKRQHSGTFIKKLENNTITNNVQRLILKYEDCAMESRSHVHQEQSVFRFGLPRSPEIVESPQKRRKLLQL